MQSLGPLEIGNHQSFGKPQITNRQSFDDTFNIKGREQLKDLPGKVEELIEQKRGDGTKIPKVDTQASAL